MRNYIISFFDVCDYPSDARTSLLRDYDKLMACNASKEVFEKHIAIYESGNITSTRDALNDAINVAKEADVSEFASQLLIFICFTKKLKELYKEKGYSEKLWLDTVLDLKYKLLECKTFHDVWGSFVAFWFPEFFELKRFAHGRLQYQDCCYWATPENLTLGNTTLVRMETQVLELHIPSSGPLKQELVYDSLKQAFDFYKQQNRLIDGLLVCECSSWLLYPKMKEFLPEDSNIRKFQDNFEITYVNEDPDFGDCWRIFNKGYGDGSKSLPRNTKLQKTYAEWLDKGNVAGTGNGLLIFDGEKIINVKASEK